MFLKTCSDPGFRNPSSTKGHRDATCCRQVVSAGLHVMHMVPVADGAQSMSMRASVPLPRWALVDLADSWPCS